MKTRADILRIAIVFMATAFSITIMHATVAVAADDGKREKEDPKKQVAHRVAAIYFHRTKRCPTCKTISAYIEEAMKGHFKEAMKKGRVSLHMIDFQDAKNAKYTKYYKIKSPTLVVVDVQDGKASSWKTLPKVWSLVYEKKKFLDYVQAAVTTYLEKK